MAEEHQLRRTKGARTGAQLGERSGRFDPRSLVDVEMTPLRPGPACVRDRGTRSYPVGGMYRGPGPPMDGHGLHPLRRSGRAVLVVPALELRYGAVQPLPRGRPRGAPGARPRARGTTAVRDPLPRRLTRSSARLRDCHPKRERAADAALRPVDRVIRTTVPRARESGSAHQRHTAGTRLPPLERLALA